MAPATYSASQPSPPLGVKIIYVLAAIGCVLGVVGSLILLSAAPLLGLVTLALTAAQFVTVYGLWHLRSWAWAAGLIVYGLSGLSQLLDLNLIGALVSFLVIGYLLTNRRLFR
ncbi:hypothetical protein SAMN05216559_0159 [Halomicrobium zhouii]|uniref:Uncharacterized protein n=1 Tax=Halomicrobium zhouii TaxID=767519 RepID=A0A1I6K573_9EURY|nr:hypothetical protein [Halomicrobium zhouii]SFR85980.1 hypothetical protein SAMN05216559_0159 [Halomicrobium zhouii]